jgi:hypothetical protein
VLCSPSLPRLISWPWWICMAGSAVTFSPPLDGWLAGWIMTLTPQQPA